MKKISRRHFLKNTVVAGTGIAAFPTVLVRKARAAWARNTSIHPNIDNLRVVGITDPGMTKKVERIPYDWSGQDALVIKNAVWENIDKLACGLAETRQTREAWKTIFIKPPRKAWSDTVVAIKTNNIAQQHTRSAVLAKICHELVRTCGVRPFNIHIYDACHGRSMHRDTPFTGLPEGCRIEDTWGGSIRETAIPEPWQNGEGRSGCLKALVSNRVDILINMAMCKGHSRGFGGFTMAMKNHFGTFSPGPGHQGGRMDYLLAINQTPEILGPMDRRTGRVLYPRQQLCLIDALWASKGGPGGAPSHQPNFLAMGVCAPVVDYQVATRFRGERMGWMPKKGPTERILKEFGYSQEDLPDGGRIIEV